MRKSEEERFWSKVDRSGDGCWEWQAKSRSPFGYGVMRIGGTPGRLVGAHRLAWQYTNGPIPEGLCVLHDCDNPPCCNPAHLHLGTKGDNATEKVERGRAVTWKNGPWKTCGKGHPKEPGKSCRVCAKASAAAWRARNPHYQRDYKRKKRAEKKAAGQHE